MEKESESESLDNQMSFLGFFQKGDSSKEIQCFFFNKAGENVLKDIKENIECCPRYKNSNNVLSLLTNEYGFRNIIVGETFGDNNPHNSATLFLYSITPSSSESNENKAKIVNLFLFEISSRSIKCGGNYLEFPYYTRLGSKQKFSDIPASTTKITNIVYIPIASMTLMNEIKTYDEEKRYDMANWRKNTKKAGEKKFEYSLKTYWGDDKMVWPLHTWFKEDDSATIYMIDSEEIISKHKKKLYLHILENSDFPQTLATEFRQIIIKLL